MAQQALGMIEAIGYTTAVSAADAALKAANVTLSSWERVIGAGGALGVTIHLSGDVAAVTSAVQAGREEAERVGQVISSHVIPRAHNEVNSKILPLFEAASRVPQKEIVAKDQSKAKLSTKGDKGKRGKGRPSPSQGDQGVSEQDSDGNEG
ncbi:BMC domain-containing protein [Marininema mesophilum]|uniref:BMC domain-containing protein n=1 Tax=Marininema mesophilum TaxID=1048340 RepID=A0A1H2QTD8_9BACL|nr:BMC domain-containing protein [Marininema mesophilum]SDW10433.1 BMC domain-containing protein [Marininema mesophilum]